LRERVWAPGLVVAQVPRSGRPRTGSRPGGTARPQCAVAWPLSVSLSPTSPAVADPRMTWGSRTGKGGTNDNSNQNPTALSGRMEPGQGGGAGLRGVGQAKQP